MTQNGNFLHYNTRIIVPMLYILCCIIYKQTKGDFFLFHKERKKSACVEKTSFKPHWNCIWNFSCGTKKYIILYEKEPQHPLFMEATSLPI